MKQHITPQQVEELSEKSKIRLIDYWNRTKGSTKDGAGRYTELPWLSIGQMIEFLQEDVYMNSDIEQWGGMGKRIWEIKTHYTRISVKKEELCDALWEAVKKLL